VLKALFDCHIMSRAAILVIAGLCLAGCSSGLAGTDANIYGSPFGQRVVGNEAYVTVSNVWSEMDALRLAETHCARSGKISKFSHMERVRAVFDCVARS
jgi:hypothetical protein